MKFTKFRGETLTLATAVTVTQTRGAPPNMNMLEVEAPSATKENLQLTFTPRLYYVTFYDASATTKYIDIRDAVTDRNTSTGSGTAFNAMQTADYWYVGSQDLRFRGLATTMGSLNAVVSTMTAEYTKNDGTWAALTITDGTASGGATLAQSGLITWTVPTNWDVAQLSMNPPVGPGSTPCYWVRFAVSAALTNPTSITELSALADTVVNSANTDAEGQAALLLQSNAQSLVPYRFFFDERKYGGIELTSTSITSAANLNWYQVKGGY